MKKSTLEIYFESLSKRIVLTPEREKILARKVKEGDKKAEAELIRANLRFVISVSRNYINQGLPIEELIGEGNKGLLLAARRFDEKKNFKFCSYAVWWIRQHILKAIADQSRQVRMPLNRSESFFRIRRENSKLEQKLGRSVSSEELAEYTGFQEEKIVQAFQPNCSNICLTDTVGDKKITWEECIASNEKVEIDENKKAIDVILEGLDSREKEVISSYFGIGRDYASTLEEIGEHLKLTRERVRQIKEKALRKLRQKIAYNDKIRGEYGF